MENKVRHTLNSAHVWVAEGSLAKNLTCLSACCSHIYHVGEMAQDVGMVWFLSTLFCLGEGGEWLLFVCLFASLFFALFLFLSYCLLWMEYLNIIDRGLSIHFFFN